MTTQPPTRLYGLPCCEELWTSPAEVYERYCAEGDGPWVVEEWSTHSPLYHLPSAERVAEFMLDMGCDNDTDGHWCDQAEAASKDPVVTHLLKFALRVMAARISYRMADRVLDAHVITIDDDGGPLLDGEPLYVIRHDGVLPSLPTPTTEA